MEVVVNGQSVEVDDLRVKLSGGVPISDEREFPALRAKVIIEAKGEVAGYDLRPIKGGGQALVVKVSVDQGLIELVPPEPGLFDHVQPADFGAGAIPADVDPDTGEVLPDAKATLEGHLAECDRCVTENGAVVTPCAAYIEMAKSLGIPEEWGK